MAKIAKITCLMCKRKPPKALTAKKGDSIYTNAQDIILFCSVRCAANWALLHAPGEATSMHFCPVTGLWEHCKAFECLDCRASDEPEDE